MVEPIETESSPTVIHTHVQQARRGELPRTICRMRSGWAVLGEVQVLRGYCLLLPDPVVSELNELTGVRRDLFQKEMALLGDAVKRVTRCRRINYEILGNVEPALHAHVFPRYDDEPEALRQRPVWFYDWSAAPRFQPGTDQDLLEALQQELETMLKLETTTRI